VLVAEHHDAMVAELVFAARERPSERSLDAEEAKVVG
jgi:hypothetical protein